LPSEILQQPALTLGHWAGSSLRFDALASAGQADSRRAIASARQPTGLALIWLFIIFRPNGPALSLDDAAIILCQAAWSRARPARAKIRVKLPSRELYRPNADALACARPNFLQQLPDSKLSTSATERTLSLPGQRHIAQQRARASRQRPTGPLAIP